MLKPAPPPEDLSIGDLVARLFDEGKAYVEAEAHLLQVKAKAQIAKYARAAQLGGVAAIFALAALVALAVTLVIGLATWLGPFGGGLVAVALFAVPAAALFYAAKRSVEKTDD